jgi:hypothetical protein
MTEKEVIKAVLKNMKGLSEKDTTVTVYHDIGDAIVETSFPGVARKFISEGYKPIGLDKRKAYMKFVVPIAHVLKPIARGRR